MNSQNEERRPPARRLIGTTDSLRGESASDQPDAGITGQVRFRHAFFAAVTGMAILQPDGSFLQVNPALCELTGYSESELLQLSEPSITHPDDLDTSLERAQRLLGGEAEAYQAEKRYIHRDGHILWVDLSVSLVRNDDGSPRYFIAQMVDINDRKQFEQQLRHQAFHDSLTGLPNRSLFMNRLEHALVRGQRTGETVAVIFIDLDNFKVINDSFGHRAGDQLLLAMAQRLQLCVRDGDTVARLGGDEFTVLLEQIDSINTTMRVAQRIAE
jgi:PAS domain S-box-containing protein